MRSTLPPGPYEGDEVVDRNGAHLGVLEELIVHGRHVSAFLVKLDDGTELELPRDWMLTTSSKTLQLRRSADEINAYMREE